MYNIEDVGQIVKNIFSLAKTVDSSIQPKNELDLKKGYINFLDDYQPSVPHNDQAKTLFICDSKLEESLAELYVKDSRLNDRNQKKIIGSSFSEKDRNFKIDQVKLAIKLLEDRNDEYYKLFNTVIHSIFFRNSQKAAGGSTSIGVGVIWMNNKDHLTTEDIAELLVHELTHSLVFLDELCFEHYKNYNDIVLEENYAKSSILKIRRPLDKVVHSIVVSTEVLLSRRSFLGFNNDNTSIHPDSTIMTKSTLEAIDSVNFIDRQKDLLTTRGREIISLCKNKLLES